MSINWDQLADQYTELATNPATSGDRLHSHNLATRDLIGRAASALPKDSQTALAWFITALQLQPQKWFVAEVMSVARPVPRTLLDPLLLAALLEPNPSANRAFVDPCVRTFGAAEVASRVRVLANYPGVAEHGGVDKVMYWVPRVGA
jgi:hypothetical protein